MVPRSIVDDPESPIASIVEAHKVQERVAIGAHVVYEAVRLEGEDELGRPAAALGICVAESIVNPDQLT
jgi:hypothetical protein